MAVALDPNDTIAAVASPAGPGLLGIVRLSGPEALSIALQGFIPDRNERAPLRRAVVRAGSMRVDGLRPLLPVLLALWPEPRTYTGQNVAEIHLPGSSPLMSLVLAQCLAAGARHAEPGEFTLRAFLCGRIDLTRAEAVLGVIDARNQAQLEAALEQLAGGLSGPILALRDRLLDVLAQLEANLDFTEEPDVDPLVRTVLAENLAGSATELKTLARRLTDRDRPEGYPRVVLAGPPNAGKSRLFNALLERDQAIVSPQAGTTRDYLTALCDCDGLTIELVDTAGIESAGDTIATRAQALRLQEAGRAQVLLDCRSIDSSIDTMDVANAPERVTLSVWTQSDRGLPDPSIAGTTPMIVTSAATGAGLETLRSAIAAIIRGQEVDGNLPAGTAARCRGSLLGAEAALRSAAETLLVGGGDELVAVDLRQAVDELGRVVGAVVTDDILDRIFSRFCIGK
jgi:tRNA modification GTPase